MQSPHSYDKLHLFHVFALFFFHIDNFNIIIAPLSYVIDTNFRRAFMNNICFQITFHITGLRLTHTHSASVSKSTQYVRMKIYNYSCCITLFYRRIVELHYAVMRAILCFEYWFVGSISRKNISICHYHSWGRRDVTIVCDFGAPLYVR